MGFKNREEKNKNKIEPLYYEQVRDIELYARLILDRVANIKQTSINAKKQSINKIDAHHPIDFQIDRLKRDIEIFINLTQKCM
jgi:hypothetical protein